MYTNIICDECGWDVCQTCGCCCNPSCERCNCPEVEVEDKHEEE